MLATAVYVFNGVTDLEADQGNASRRPIASGRLGLSDAMVACVALSAGGVVLCGYAGVTDLVLALLFLALGWAYSTGPAWKNGPVTSPAVIGAGAGLTYAAGLICRHQSSVRDAVVAAALAVWVGTCCGSKDFSDIPGDRLAGRRTWPVLFGSQRAAQLVAAIALLIGTAGLAVSFEFDRDQFPVGCVLALGSVILAAVLLGTASSPKREIRRRGYRAFMTTQYAVNLTMIIAG
jgi:4-hydroxybenzoate polyprenyltransferase